jgi:hypothetical protein
MVIVINLASQALLIKKKKKDEKSTFTNTLNFKLAPMLPFHTPMIVDKSSF